MNKIKSAIYLDLEKIVVTPELERRTFHRIDNYARMNSGGRVKSLSALMVAALLVALMAGAALAAIRSGVLDYIFSGARPNPEAAKLVEQVNNAVTMDGITLSFDDTLVTDEGIWVSYTVSSERDEALILSVAESNIAGEKPIDYDYMVYVFDAEIDGTRTPKSFQRVWQPWGMENAEPFELTVTARVSRPLKPLVSDPGEGIDHWNHPELYDEEKSMAACKDNDVIPVRKSGITEFMKWYLPIGEVGVTELYAQGGYLEPVAEITHSITIDPKTQSATPKLTLPEPVVFEYDDRTITIETVHISATDSYIKISAMPKKRLEESGLSKEAYSEAFQFYYALLNENGEDLTGTNYSCMPPNFETIYDDSDWFLTASAQQMDSWERPYISAPYWETGFIYEYNGPLIEMPRKITFAPAILDENRKVVDYDMAWAMTVELVSSGE